MNKSLKSYLSKIQITRNQKLGIRRQKSKEKRKRRRKNHSNMGHLSIASYVKLNELEYYKEFHKYGSGILKYLLNCRDSDFFQFKATANLSRSNYFYIPEKFSFRDEPRKTFKFLSNVLGALFTQKHEIVYIDYTQCEKIDLEAQVMLDIILKFIIEFYNKLVKNNPKTLKMTSIQGRYTPNSDIEKLLYSVGSPALHAGIKTEFSDIIPYTLCIHDGDLNRDPREIRETNEIDATLLADYVLDSLRAMNIHLSPERIHDLCVVVGEILINAEEHSSTKHRFSIGYCQTHTDPVTNLKYGIFKLTILNLGKTIYEKFKDPLCQNQDIVEKMRNLSYQYSKGGLFRKKQFEEEALWSLYALQEGVSSVTKKKGNRGNGSIQFIEKFFNLRNENEKQESFLSIRSGKTLIEFDGSYRIFPKATDDGVFNLMTFNNENSLEFPPDSKYVKHVENYFPGTIINAKIVFNEQKNSNE